MERRSARGASGGVRAAAGRLRHRLAGEGRACRAAGRSPRAGAGRRARRRRRAAAPRRRGRAPQPACRGRCHRGERGPWARRRPAERRGRARRGTRWQRRHRRWARGRSAPARPSRNSPRTMARMPAAASSRMNGSVAASHTIRHRGGTSRALQLVRAAQPKATLAPRPRRGPWRDGRQGRRRRPSHPWRAAGSGVIAFMIGHPIGHVIGAGVAGADHAGLRRVAFR